MGGLDLDAIDLDALRARRSMKWRAYPPDVLPSWVAEMDFPLAPPVKEALRAAVERDDCGYAAFDGLADAFAGYAKDRLAWSVDTSRVKVSADVMAGIGDALRVLTDPGDAVVVNPPVYPPFFSAVRDAERRLVEVAMLEDEAGRWELDLDGLERAFAAGARAWLLCNPHNPTGRVLSRTELEAAAALAVRYGVVVLADEIHAPLTLPGAVHTPYVSLGEEAAGDAVTFASASKAWNVAGLKCAVLVAGSERTRRRLAAIPKELSYRTGHLGVIAAIAAFTEGGEWLDAVCAHVDRNRGLLPGLLAEHLPGVRCSAPEASYLAWLDCRGLGLGDDPAAAFLERGRVALSAGLDFGAPGAGFARLNMATSRALLNEAVTRMAAALPGP